MQRGMGILAIFAALVAGARFTAGPSLQKTSEAPTDAAVQIYLSAPHRRKPAARNLVTREKKAVQRQAKSQP